MSKTFTSRPAVTQGRGRGRGTQTRQTNPANNTATRMDTGTRPRVGASQNPRPQTEEPQAESNDIGQRMSYEGGFTKITPNMKKRQQINAVASRETESYEEHKKQNTPTSFSYVGTVGGTQLSQGESRQKLVQTSPNKTQKLLQNQQRKSFMKQKEDEELQKKKEAQRQKAQQNEQKRKETEAAVANRWDEPKRRTNEAFLNRIEAKNKQTMQGGSKTGPSVSERQTVKEESSKSHVRSQPVRSQPEGACAARETTGQHVYTDSAECSPSSLSSEQRQALTALSAVFPGFPQETLLEMLEQVDFSVDSAIMLLAE